MKLDQRTLGILSQVCRDACGRIRMKYYYNYAFCSPPFGISWWRLAEDTAVTIDVCVECFQEYLETALERRESPEKGLATKGFCLEICGIPAMVLLTYKYRAELLGGAEEETTTCEAEEDMCNREEDETKCSRELDVEKYDQVSEGNVDVVVTDLEHMDTKLEWGNTSRGYQRFLIVDDVSIAEDFSSVEDGWQSSDELYESDFYD